MPGGLADQHRALGGNLWGLPRDGPASRVVAVEARHHIAEHGTSRLKAEVRVIKRGGGGEGQRQRSREAAEVEIAEMCGVLAVDGLVCKQLTSTALAPLLTRVRSAPQTACPGRAGPELPARAGGCTVVLWRRM